MGLIVVVACCGWGVLLGRLLGLAPGGRPLPPGMAGAFGMAWFIFLSGPVLLFGLFGRIQVGVFLAIGLGLALGWRPARETFLRLPWPTRRDMQVVTGLIALYLLFLMIKAAANRDYNEYDDFRAYFPFVRRMLDTGSLLDPFSFRRLAALGGHLALETLTLTFLPWKYGNLLDWGVAGMIIGIMVYEQVEGDSVLISLGRCVLVVVAVTYPMQRLNTASSLTTVVMMFGLLRALDYITDREASGWKGALLAASFAGALATLRAQNFFAAGLLLVAYFAFRWWTDRKERSEVLRQAVRTFAATFAFLVSWMVLQQLSSRTFLYPLIRGNHQPIADIFNGGQPLSALLAFVAQFFLDVRFAVLFVPVFFMASKRHRDTALVLTGCVLLICLAMVLKFTSSDPINLHRYLIPLALGLGLYTSGHVVRRFASGVQLSERVTWSLAAMATVVLAVIAFYRVGSDVNPLARFKSIELALWPTYEFDGEPVRNIPSVAPVEADYARALATVPRGGHVLTSLDYPFLLDYRAYHFDNIDIQGVASPPPGMPSFQGSAAVKSYLLGQGIDYIAYSPFDHALFIDSIQAQIRDRDGPNQRLHLTSRLALEFMKNVNELAKSNQVLYQDDTIHIIHLVR